MTSITFILVILLFLLSFTLSSSITNNNDNIYQYEHLINNFFSNEFVKIPGTYMTENYRNDNNNFVNDFNLNTVPTYNVNHKNGVKTNWLHHTYPNEIFNTPSNVEKAKKAIEHLLWKGLSKLKDTIETLTNTIVNDESKTKQWKLRIVENYIVSLKQIISSYNDFYLQVCNTFEIGSDGIHNPKDNEYGPETNFWIHFRSYISCHHETRLGPEVGGQKHWCNPSFFESGMEGKTFILSAGSGGDFSYEEYVTKTFSNVVIVTPDCTTFDKTDIVKNENTGSTIVTTPVCLTGTDPKYISAIDPGLKSKFHRFHELYNGLAKHFGEEEFHFSLLKVNIEGFEYPLFADIFSNNPERLLNGVSQIHIEQHRQGMQMFGLNWNSLVFGELLFAHFFSGGFIPFAQEKWHDSTAAQDIAFVNQTWYILSENDARNKILNDMMEPYNNHNHNNNNNNENHSKNTLSTPNVKSNMKIENDYYCATGPLLSAQVSNIIIQESEATGWDTRPDLVDRVPEWSLHVYYCKENNCPGWNPNVPESTTLSSKWLVKKIEEKASKCNSLQNPKIKIYWVYIKKYSSDTRSAFPIHTDSCSVTGNVLLNNENDDFFGGEYFLLNEKRSTELKVGRNVEKEESFEELAERRRLITNKMLKSGEFNKWNIKNEQGSGVIHFGKSAHGVLNVSKGIRYCIVFFADFVEE